MIDHENHYARYQELMNLASNSSPARQNDGGYMAAIYILSSDEELSAIARCKIGPEGISFSGILSAARRAELSGIQYTALRAAHSLFNDGSRTKNTPLDLAQCDYTTLDIITDAMYIWKCGCIPTADSSGQMCLDRTGEYRRRGLELALSQHFAAAECAAQRVEEA